MPTPRTAPTPRSAPRVAHARADDRALARATAAGLFVAALWAALAPGSAVADEAFNGSGLRLQAPATATWSARFGWSEANLDPTLASPVTARLSWQWLGDYRFAPAWGLRATGGVRGQFDLAGLPGLNGSADLASGRTGSAMRIGALPSGSGVAGNEGSWTSPYLGVGYDASASLRNGWGGWGLSADLGLQTRRPPGLRLGSNADTEEGWRSMRLTPVLQVGVSYSF